MKAFAYVTPTPEVLVSIPETRLKLGASCTSGTVSAAYDLTSSRVLFEAKSETFRKRATLFSAITLNVCPSTFRPPVS